ncbi:MAG: Arc family DNA-binding protein, partial [Acinetobacter sp.]|nr:Arc family DNA-binding protein [Acinetobacter sp.]
MAKDYTQVNFRIPTSLKEKIDQAAIENDQSITAEIVARLESSFNTSKN